MSEFNLRNVQKSFSAIFANNPENIVELPIIMHAFRKQKCQAIHFLLKIVIESLLKGGLAIRNQKRFINKEPQNIKGSPIRNTNFLKKSKKGLTNKRINQ